MIAGAVVEIGSPWLLLLFPVLLVVSGIAAFGAMRLIDALMLQACKGIWR